MFFIKKEFKPTLNRDGAMNFHRFMILYWQHHVLEHHQHPELEDHLSVNTQLPTADDGVGLLWNIRLQNLSVEDQF